ncbi:hypothetical protein GCG54_00015240 [Colletotrichum gloeosporioides]|uniref:Uncharacterized protein n=1 Tax=Colletotrichum gloeosporioides TaxID=474922 RepID=A0A8H4C6T0_COLGL|nr:uncharacterized protein GCG54_00015240 [Colletotrichum gloeosporioides]KAF3798307.1 hypothetical protein GCG54_00015240 [Colletotrichum gloeosporioides]
MSDIRQRKRPREGEAPEGEGSGSVPDASASKLQEQIEGYRHALDKAVRKASSLERDVLSTTGKVHDSLVQGNDLQIQWTLWLKAHITLLKSRCCKCDGPKWQYLFAKCKHVSSTMCYCIYYADGLGLESLRELCR